MSTEDKIQRAVLPIPDVKHVGLMTYDPGLADLWINSLIENGEVETISIVRDEALRRSQDPDYQPCEPPRLRFEFPYFYMGEERVNW